MSLRKRAIAGYESALEATHHGPTCLPFPLVFVEVGSSEAQWNDKAACAVAAATIAGLVQDEPSGCEVPSAIGLGGGHYCRKFSEVEDYALGHICPRYNLPNLDEEMLGQMIERTVPRPGHALVDKKGLGPHKKEVSDLLSKTGLEVVGV